MLGKKKDGKRKYTRRYGSNYFKKKKKAERYEARALEGVARLDNRRRRPDEVIPFSFTLTRDRSRMIRPSDEGKLLAIHNGVRYVFLGLVAKKYIGMKLGEFAFTKQKRIFIHQDNKIEMKRRKKASASRKGRAQKFKGGKGVKGKVVKGKVVKGKVVKGKVVKKGVGGKGASGGKAKAKK